MSKGSFLFEIGTEEIPAGYIAGAVEKLRESITNDLNEYRLAFGEVKMFSTPRRLGIKILDIDSSQADQTVEKTGPAKKVAVDEAGALTKAGQGFLTGAAASEKDIYFVETPKGEYIAVKVFIKGKSTQELLPVMMKNALERISFPKTMKWGEQKFMFARPIRWLVALWDDAVIPFEFNGLVADRISHGNRYQKKDNVIAINQIAEYPDILLNVKVIADRDKRKSTIAQQLKAMNDEQIAVIPDERLLDTVTDLVEYPTAVKAHFDQKYLILPPKIITSTLSQNQKYFSTTTAQQSKSEQLTDTFVFISNGNPDHSDIIRLGNEKVVQARLEDAQFYFTEDTKKPLADYVPKLADVVFQAKLGTLLEKTERIKKLCQYIAEALGLDAETTADVLRAAHLCKADLVTMMLGEKEFTKLQGYIGMHYALHSGEKPQVAEAIYEHYMPRGQNDGLPQRIGSIVAIADKLDTVCGIIGVGLMPTGSNDPFAIRRAANGIVQIIDKHSFDLSLPELVNTALECLADKLNTPLSTLNTQIVNFFKQRTRWLLDEFYHIEYDIVDALDIFEWDKVIEIKNRAIDLQSFKKNPDFQILVSGYKRVANILSKCDAVPDTQNVSPNTQADPAEITLHNHLQKIKTDIAPLLATMEYKKIMEKIVPMGADIDTFFDKVLVMCDDEALRRNRLALLAEIKDLFLKVADISRINYEN